MTTTKVKVMTTIEDMTRSIMCFDEIAPKWICGTMAGSTSMPRL